MKRKLLSVIISALLVFSNIGLVRGEILPHNSEVVRPAIVSHGGSATPIVNIVAPNVNGLSHNKYEKFDVDANGAVLNNAIGTAQSEIIGEEIAGNPNLTESAAQVILNEILSIDKSRSQINGAVEIAGAAADLIIANAYGITINGGSFINANKVSLVAGSPVIAEEALKSFTMGRSGFIEVGSGGLDATNSAIEIISRYMKIMGELKGKGVEIKTGNIEYNYETGEMISGELEGEEEEDPIEEEFKQYAVSAAAFGSIHGDRIKIIATEKGLGVKTASGSGLVSNVSEIRIESAGEIEVGGDITSETDITIESQDKINNFGKLQAAEAIEITAE
ncbi:MAG: filamentous hemagglutinin N-terminal domain-containing protein, partial [Endomicrobium sp.]|nr:filamentous hemagglutinin N-terminal domain-containing protein [Endomicrobium sp.]